MLLTQSETTGYFTRGIDEDGNLLEVGIINVHDPLDCEGRGCAIHNHPTLHGLAMEPLYWNDSIGLLERICVHDTHHPDKDGADYMASIGARAWRTQHDCDGCCDIK